MGSNDKVILTCAMSGAVTTRKQCPAIPYTVEDYANEAKRAYDGGAAIVHIHARTDDGQPTYDPGRYMDIARAIRGKCPIILNFSTGAIGMPMEDRVRHVTDVKPEIGALNMGSLTYAKYSYKRKDFVFDFVFANPFRDIIFLLKKMNEAGVKPELECFDTGHVAAIEPLLDMGVLKLPLDFSLILGVDGGIPATGKHLAFQASNIPAGCTWKVIGIRHALRPFRATRVFWGAAAVLELPSGTLSSSSTSVGDVIEFRAVSPRSGGPANGAAIRS